MSFLNKAAGFAKQLTTLEKDEEQLRLEREADAHRPEHEPSGAVQKARPKGKRKKGLRAATPQVDDPNHKQREVNVSMRSSQISLTGVGRRIVQHA